MVDIIMIRTHSHEAVETFSKYSDVPVINGLTKALHPVKFLPTLLPTLNLEETLRTRELLGLVMVTTCVIVI